jgi:hypothetical protein
MGRPEGVIENYLKKQSEKLGFLCYKFTSPANSGVPDRLIIGHGATFFVETKAPGEEPRKLQKCVINRMIDHGARVYVIDNKDSVDELLQSFVSQKPLESNKIKYP